jgi:hypothetical protein
MAWVRSGYCCRCGDCCKGNAYDPDNPVRNSPAMAQPPVVEGYCPLFNWSFAGDPNGPGFCRGHTGAVPAGQEDPYYLSGCNIWPDDPHQIKDYPNCTYTFAWS